MTWAGGEPLGPSMGKKPEALSVALVDLPLDPGLSEKAKQWFAEARAQTERDKKDIDAWIDRNTGGFDEGGERLPRSWLLKGHGSNGSGS